MTDSTSENIHLLVSAMRRRLISSIFCGSAATASMLLARDFGSASVQPAGHAVLDDLGHAAEARSEQRPAGRLGVGHDERAGIVPDRWGDHYVHLLVEIVRHHRSP